MGTRNLTMVIKDKKPIIAQYGQFNGFPSRQGVTILEFLRNTDMEKFEKQLKRVRFITPKKENEINKYLKSIGCVDGYLDMEQVSEYRKKYPLLSRETGGNVLDMIYNDNGRNLLWLYDKSDFAADSLYCEWAYVIDLDNGTLGVYRGFNTTPLTKKDRFFYLQKNIHNNGYYPVKKLTAFSLIKLPTNKRFISLCNKLNEKYE